MEDTKTTHEALANAYEDVATALDTIEVAVSAIEQRTDALRARSILTIQGARLTDAIQQRLVNVITRMPAGYYEAHWVLKGTNILARPLRDQLVNQIMKCGNAHIQLETANHCRHNLSKTQELRLRL